LVSRQPLSCDDDRRSLFDPRQAKETRRPIGLKYASTTA
jgi:hypothetical protein